MPILIVNHSEKQCGVHQYGKRFADIAIKSTDLEYIYREVDSLPEFRSIVNSIKPELVIYNFYPCTMGWLPENYIIQTKTFKHFFIWHDGFHRHNYDGYLFGGVAEKEANFRIPQNKTFVIGRPLFKYTNTHEKNSIPTIGSFGFGGWQKGFTDLVTEVNNTFDEAILNINMTYAHFGDMQGIETRKIAAACRELNTNPGIQLNITHDFKSNLETLDFLAKNDLNAFLYVAYSEGISSATDYALSVHKPIALGTHLDMFRHIAKDEIILTPSNSLKDIMDRDTEPLEGFYTQWTQENFIGELDNVIKQNIN